MGTYNEWIDGYVFESTWGTSAIALSSTTAYKLGLLGNEAETIWDTVAESLYAPTAVNTKEVAAERLYKTKFKTTCSMVVGVQNAVLLYLAMGKSSTSADDPQAGYNTHTITPTTDGSDMPSVTWQHEKKGSATSWATQYLGATVSRMVLRCSTERRMLEAELNWMAKKPTDPGFVLDAAPALPATANASPFKLSNTTVTYNSVNISEYVRAVEFETSPNIEEIFGHTWTGGTYDGHWPNKFLEDYRKEYTVRLTVTPWADDVWDDLISVTNTAAALKDGSIKFTRNATLDYIQLNFTDLMVLEHPVKTPTQGNEELVTIVMEPRTVSITAIDQLAGSAYNE